MRPGFIMLYDKPTKKSSITTVSFETQPEEYKYTFVRPGLAHKEFTEEGRGQTPRQ